MVSKKKTIKSLIKLWQDIGKKVSSKRYNQSKTLEKRPTPKPRPRPRPRIKRVTSLTPVQVPVPLPRKRRLSRKKYVPVPAIRHRRSSKIMRKKSSKNSSIVFNENQLKVLKEMLKTEQRFLQVMEILKDICEYLFEEKEKEKYEFIYSVLNFSKKFISQLEKINGNKNVEQSLAKCHDLFKILYTNLKETKNIHYLLIPYLTKRFLDKENKKLTFDFIECSEKKGLKSLVKLFNIKNIEILEDGIQSVSILLIQRIAKYPMLFSELVKYSETKHNFLEDIKNITSDLAMLIDTKMNFLTEEQKVIDKEFLIRDKYCQKLINQTEFKCDALNKLCKSDDSCSLPYCKKRRKGYRNIKKCRVKEECYNTSKYFVNK